MLGVASGFGQGTFGPNIAQEMRRGNEEPSGGVWVTAGGYCEGSGRNCDEIFSLEWNASRTKARWDGSYASGSRRGRDGARESGGERACGGRARGRGERQRRNKSQCFETAEIDY